jgi:3-phenylpropionate/trans-cinnamate dioxygenase ferredoxin subunit
VSDPARSGASWRGATRAEPARADGFEYLADADDVPEGSLVGVTNAAGDEICLYNFRGTIGAVQGVCTHAEFPLSDGTLKTDGTIECVWHGAQFDCRSGAVCRGPAIDALPVYEVRVEGSRVMVGRRRP